MPAHREQRSPRPTYPLLQSELLWQVSRLAHQATARARGRHDAGRRKTEAPCEACRTPSRAEEVVERTSSNGERQSNGHTAQDHRPPKRCAAAPDEADGFSFVLTRPSAGASPLQFFSSVSALCVYVCVWSGVDGCTCVVMTRLTSTSLHCRYPCPVHHTPHAVPRRAKRVAKQKRAECVRPGEGAEAAEEKRRC